MSTAHLLITLVTTSTHLMMRDRRRTAVLAWDVAAGVLGPAVWVLRTAVVLAARRGDVDTAEGLALALEQVGLPGELVDVAHAAARWTRRRLDRRPHLVHADC